MEGPKEMEETSRRIGSMMNDGHEEEPYGVCVAVTGDTLDRYIHGMIVNTTDTNV